MGTWKRKACFDACMLPFARCHTMDKCMKNEWFNFDHDRNTIDNYGWDGRKFSTTGPLWVNKQAVVEAENCDASLVLYDSCRLDSYDPVYWQNNFLDLLQIC